MNNEETILIKQVLELVETMEEGLLYIDDRLRNFDIKNTFNIFVDLIDAFGSIEKILENLNDKLMDNNIKENTDTLRKSLNNIVKEYENINGQSLIESLESGLLPAFTAWKTELEIILNPYIIS